MFYLSVLYEAGKVVAEIEENDYEAFIVKCYNFREEAGLNYLRVFLEESDGKRRLLSTEAIEEMIETWLDPDFIFAMGYPISH